MTTWYVARGRQIDPVEVIEETEHFIRLASSPKRRQAKHTGWSSYYRTREEAKAAMVSGAKSRVEHAELALAWAKRNLAEIEAL